MANLCDDYQHQRDEELCALAVSGDRRAEEILVKRYSRAVRVHARPYFLAGGDSEDLSQEGMFGLLKAIREFDASLDVSFRTFAEVCIHRRILSAVAAASRDKHAPLNESVPIETPFFDDCSEIHTGAQSHGNPEELLIDREERGELLGRLKDQLSDFESEVLGDYLSGFSYIEIARRVRRSPKSVDNAVQRIRRKLARQFSSGGFSQG